MPFKSKNGSFPVVSGTIAIIAAVFLATHALRASIPARATNKLVADQEDFLIAGTREDIDWLAMDSEALRLARRTDRPIFVLIGAQCSRQARQVDKLTFIDPEVVDLLRRRFICVRVDAYEMPEWTNAYVPMTRATFVSDQQFQSYILDPSGAVYFFPDEGKPPLYEDLDTATGMLAFLRGSLRYIESVHAGERVDLRPGERQAAEIRTLTGEDAQGGTSPNFQQHHSAIQARASVPFGGFPIRGRQQLSPYVWQFLSEANDKDGVLRTLDPVLASPIVDWLDGGFFRSSSNISWTEIEFDKIAVENAEMMVVLARLAVLYENRFYAQLARRTYASLMGEFRQGRSFFSYRLSDANEARRSARSSFSPRTMRDQFSADERDWLRQNLGLRVETNPQMSAKVSDPESLLSDPESFGAFISKMREIRKDTLGTYGAAQQLDTSGTVVARLLETARTLNDTTMLQNLGSAFPDLKEFQLGEAEVVHSLRPRQEGYRYLGDYLAYADAALQDFLTYGRLTSLTVGQKVLSQALTTFRGTKSGVLLEGKWDRGELAPVGVPTPSLFDFTGESNIAKAIRLCTGYGQALQVISGTEEMAPSRLLQEAQSMVSRFASAANSAPVEASSYFCAALDALGQRFLVVVGPTSITEAREIAPAVPGAIVIPALAPSKEAYANAAPGYYVVRNGTRTGPLTKEAATAALRAPNPIFQP